MYFMPQLVFKKLNDLDPKAWLQKLAWELPSFELWTLFGFESAVHKNRFAQYCIIAIQVLGPLASMIQTELKCYAQETVMVFEALHFQVVLQCDENKLLLAVRLNNDVIIPETVWILLNELSSKLGPDEDCQLVCPFSLAPEECNHGDYNPLPNEHGPSLESALKQPKRWKRKLFCAVPIDWKHCFPTQLAIDMMKCLHPNESISHSPFDGKPLEQADYLENHNMISVTFTKDIPDPSKIRSLPPFRPDSHKLFRFVQPVRQYFDNIFASCKHEEKCPCYLPEYVKMFALLEENGLIVTKGEWKATMRALLEKYTKCDEYDK